MTSPLPADSSTDCIDATISVRPSDPDAARELGRACDLSETTAQVLLHRGYGDETSARAFLSPRLSELTAPDCMADREAAAERLGRAVRMHERIAVFGDYDVDGTTSAAILSSMLEALGGEVVTLLANRFDGGYGFSDAALARCVATGAQLIVTCDCGSSDHERIHQAMSKGIDVIVVDHHLVPAERLPALAFLNPHRPECRHPYKWLTSAGLALLLGAAVRTRLGAQLDLRSWLDLVALGTIADIAPLDGDNRRLVRAGLRALALPEVRPGIMALRELAQLRASYSVRAADVSFRLAPRLNAAGRLGDPMLTLELLRARTIESARALAARVEQINEQRRAVEREVTEAACAQVEEIYGPRPSTGVVVAAEGWHRGVVGITAARLVDRYHVPSIVVGLTDGIGHGSARAPKGFRLYDAVSSCRESLRAYGGHQAAAGLTVEAHKIDALRATFADVTRPHLDDVASRYVADVAVDGCTFSLPRASELFRLEPLGEANAEPLFALWDAVLEERRVVGEHHLKLGLRLGRQTVPAFAANMAGVVDRLPSRGNFVGHLRPDGFRGGEAIELHVVAVGHTGV